MNATTAVGGMDGLGDLIREVRTLEKGLRQITGPGEEAFPMGGRAVLQALLEHGLQTVPQIARRRGTSRQNIQILVNGLRAAGWVEMAANPAHRRSELVQLTGNGRGLVNKIAAEEWVFLEGLSGQVPAEAVSAATGVLRQLRELIGGEREPKERRVLKRAKQQAAAAVLELEQQVGAGGQSEPEEEEMPVSLL